MSSLDPLAVKSRLGNMGSVVEFHNPLKQ